MSNATEKAIGIIFLVILVLVVFFAATPLFFFGFRSGPFAHLNLGFPGAIPFGLITFCLLVLWVLVIVWVYRDAERRGMSGVLWALLVFIGNVLGLLIYLIVRNDTVRTTVNGELSTPCAGCGKPVARSYSFCPHCGKQIRAECPSCHKTVSQDWLVCPYCGVKLTKKS